LFQVSFGYGDFILNAQAAGADSAEHKDSKKPTTQKGEMKKNEIALVVLVVIAIVVVVAFVWMSGGTRPVATTT
jgi:hypothetical protein